MPAVLPFLPYIGAGASFLGGLLGNKQTSSTTPSFDPAFSPLKNSILQMTMQRLNQDPNLSGYQANGIAGINRGFNDTATAANNDLTARGLSTSPIAGTVDAIRENTRAGAVNTFSNSIPLLARQLKGEDLQLAGNVLNLGRGQTTTQTGGGGLAGGVTQLGSYLGYLSGKGAFGNTGVSGGAGFTPSTPGVPLLPFGAAPRPAGSWGAPTYQPQGFTGWMG